MRALVVLSAVLAALAAAAPASAAWPGRNGALVLATNVSCRNTPTDPGLQGVPCDGLWSVRPDGGGLRALEKGSNNIFTPAVSPDGRSLLTWEPMADLAVRRISGALVSHVAGGGQMTPVWRPGRRGIGWARGLPSGGPVPGEPGCFRQRTRIYRADQDGLGARAIATATRNAVAPAWSASGRLITYAGWQRWHYEGQSSSEESECLSSHRSSLWVQPAGHPERARRLAPVERGSMGDLVFPRPDFSPDGRRLAYVSGGAVHVIGVDGRGPRTVAGSNGAMSVAWSPDGRWIAWVTDGKAALLRAPARGGRARAIARWDASGACAGCGLTGLAWQPLPHGGTSR